MKHSVQVSVESRTLRPQLNRWHSDGRWTPRCDWHCCSMKTCTCYCEWAGPGRAFWETQFHIALGGSGNQHNSPAVYLGQPFSYPSNLTVQCSANGNAVLTNIITHNTEILKPSVSTEPAEQISHTHGSFKHLLHNSVVHNPLLNIISWWLLQWKHTLGKSPPL